MDLPLTMKNNSKKLPTLHYVTIHQNPAWVNLQLKHIEYFTENYKVWALGPESMCRKPWTDKFHYFGPKKSTKRGASRNHAEALGKLSEIVCEDTSVSDEDILIFMDSDAWPVTNINKYIAKKLNDYDFAAVNRREMESKGEECKAPHPSFAFCKVSFWKKYPFSWDASVRTRAWQNDTGGLLYRQFLEYDINWYRMYRTPLTSLTTDPVCFSVYDDAVYHHGCGSRPKATRLTSRFLRKHGPFRCKLYNMQSRYALEQIKRGWFF
jgi:hypothetical protein